MELLKASIQRINQLGYFRPIEQPVIEPSSERRDEARHHPRRGRGEPEPAHLRGRGLRARGPVRERVVRDHELPGTRRDGELHRPDRQPHPELPDRDHRSLLHGQADHARLRRVQPGPEAARVHARRHRGPHRLRRAARPLVAGFPELRLLGHHGERARPRHRPQPLRPLLQLHLPGPALLRALRQLPREQDQPDLRLQHRGPPDLPEHRAETDRFLRHCRRPAWAATSTTTSRPWSSCTTCG